MPWKVGDHVRAPRAPSQPWLRPGVVIGVDESHGTVSVRFPGAELPAVVEGRRCIALPPACIEKEGNGEEIDLLGEGDQSDADEIIFVTDEPLGSGIAYGQSGRQAPGVPAAIPSTRFNPVGSAVGSGPPSEVALGSSSEAPGIPQQPASPSSPSAPSSPSLATPHYGKPRPAEGSGIGRRRGVSVERTRGRGTFIDESDPRGYPKCSRTGVRKEVCECCHRRKGGTWIVANCSARPREDHGCQSEEDRERFHTKDVSAPSQGRHSLDRSSPGTATCQAVMPRPATPEPATLEPATPEPATPEPATPEPASPEPASPEPQTLGPATPEPSAIELATVEHATAEHASLQHATLEPPVSTLALPAPLAPAIGTASAAEQFCEAPVAEPIHDESAWHANGPMLNCGPLDSTGDACGAKTMPVHCGCCSNAYSGCGVNFNPPCLIPLSFSQAPYVSLAASPFQSAAPVGAPRAPVPGRLRDPSEFWPEAEDLRIPRKKSQRQQRTEGRPLKGEKRSKRPRKKKRTGRSQRQHRPEEVREADQVSIGSSSVVDVELCTRGGTCKSKNGTKEKGLPRVNGEAAPKASRNAQRIGKRVRHAAKGNVAKRKRRIESIVQLSSHEDVEGKAGCALQDTDEPCEEIVEEIVEGSGPHPSPPGCSADGEDVVVILADTCNPNSGPSEQAGNTGVVVAATSLGECARENTSDMTSIDGKRQEDLRHACSESEGVALLPRCNGRTLATGRKEKRPAESGSSSLGWERKDFGTKRVGCSGVGAIGEMGARTLRKRMDVVLLHEEGDSGGDCGDDADYVPEVEDDEGDEYLEELDTRREHETFRSHKEKHCDETRTVGGRAVVPRPHAKSHRPSPPVSFDVRGWPDGEETELDEDIPLAEIFARRRPMNLSTVASMKDEGGKPKSPVLDSSAYRKARPSDGLDGRDSSILPGVEGKDVPCSSRWDTVRGGKGARLSRNTSTDDLQTPSDLCVMDLEPGRCTVARAIRGPEGPREAAIHSRQARKLEDAIQEAGVTGMAGLPLSKRAAMYWEGPQPCGRIASKNDPNSLSVQSPKCGRRTSRRSQRKSNPTKLVLPVEEDIEKSRIARYESFVPGCTSADRGKNPLGALLKAPASISASGEVSMKSLQASTYKMWGCWCGVQAPSGYGDLQCALCLKWSHGVCSGISEVDYEILRKAPSTGEAGRMVPRFMCGNCGEGSLSLPGRRLVVGKPVCGMEAADVLYAVGNLHRHFSLSQPAMPLMRIFRRPLLDSMLKGAQRAMRFERNALQDRLSGRQQPALIDIASREKSVEAMRAGALPADTVARLGSRSVSLRLDGRVEQDFARMHCVTGSIDATERGPVLSTMGTHVECGRLCKRIYKYSRRRGF